MSDEIFGVMVDGQEAQISLADLAGVDMSGVDEFRGGGALPAGVYEFRIAGTGLDTLTFVKGGEEVTSPVIDFNCEVLAVRNLKSGEDGSNYVGASHNERFFISDLRKDLGRVVAMLKDLGMTNNGPLNELLDQAVGMEFSAVITNRKDKNNPDRVYANLDGRSITPLQGAAVPPAAQASPAPAAAPTAAPAGGLNMFGK